MWTKRVISSLVVGCFVFALVGVYHFGSELSFATPNVTWGRILDQKTKNLSSLEEISSDKKSFDCNIRSSCDLNDPSLGIPVILLSLGRSGSSSTWEVTSRLTGRKTMKLVRAAEDPGSDKIETVAFLQAQDPREDGHCWMERILCEKQLQNQKLNAAQRARIFGTKWKYFLPAFNMTKSLEALQWIAKNPNIKVIFSERNPLDVSLSRMKHKPDYTGEAHANSDEKLRAHCKPNDIVCVLKHKEQAKHTVVEDLDLLKEWIAARAHETKVAKKLLDDFNVSRVEVTYEKLYYEEGAEEWKSILRFLGRPRESLTMKKVKSKMTSAATGGLDRSTKASNWEEVEEALKGTDLERYLYSNDPTTYDRY